MNRIATGEGPSWGPEYKVKPYLKGEVAVGGRISGQMGI
nr:polymorphic toxin type 25 domain-containing protein [Enterobacter asburiae]